MVPSSFGCGSVVLAAIAMLAPSRASLSAIALPIPRLPPVIITVFPFSDILSFPVVDAMLSISLKLSKYQLQTKAPLQGPYNFNMQEAQASFSSYHQCVALLQ